LTVAKSCSANGWFARSGQGRELVAWADEFDDATRTWAIESAGGLGYLLAQQLLAAGAHVVDALDRGTSSALLS
jgi:hypothetical protein